MKSRGFGSDNHSGVHPRYLTAIQNANTGHAASYGTDEWSQRAHAVLCEHFGPHAKSYFVFNGTAANVLAISAFVQSHHVVIATSQAHILNDECGAPEKFIGCKTLSVVTTDGKLRPELIRPHLIRRGDQHYSQARLLTLTQPTEVGTVYTLAELRALGDFAKQENLIVHLDGARFVNAAESLGCSMKAMTDACNADVLSLGGTKNGLLFGEAVVFLKANAPKDFKYVRKQAMQLPSKTRYVAAQFCEFLGTDLWMENARVANARAQRLYEGLTKIKHVRLTQVAGANSVFLEIPKSWVATLRELAFFYVWDERSFECRLMTTWDTEEADVDQFLAKMTQLDRQDDETCDGSLNGSLNGSSNGSSNRQTEND